MFKPKKLKPPSSESSTSSRASRPVTETEYHPDAENHQLTIWVSIGAVVASLLLVGGFFVSNARENIVAAKQASLVTPVMAETKTTPPETDNLEEPDVMPEATEPVPLAEQLDEMSTDEVIALAETLETVIKNNPERFERSAEDVGAVEKGGMTLAEAYAEAERRYPDKVDASKRLKLVSDLGSGAYWYYVAEQGDTLIGLSEAFNVPLGQLVELNGMRDADRLPAGMIILLPDEAFVPADRQVDK